MDFPEPDKPVRTTSLFLGSSKEISFKFPSLAPSIIMLFTSLPRFNSLIRIIILDKFTRYPSGIHALFIVIKFLFILMASVLIILIGNEIDGDK